MATDLPDLVQQFSKLVSAESVSCTDRNIDQGNRAVTEVLEDWFSHLGFETRIQTVDERAGKYNLIASMGTGDGGLVLAGHTDTVPCDEQLWQHDPFRLIDADDRFYGLGITDMKGFFALILEALKDIDLKRLRQPIIILATCDEETSMAGARAIAEQGSALGLDRARYAVIGEPTSMRPVRMHKGMMMQGIRLTGRSGHSSDPALGVNALESMHKVISDLMGWRDELQAANRDPMFAVPVPTMNFGHIHGGDNPNRICGHCELQIDIRPLPGMPVAELRDTLRHRVDQVLEDDQVDIEMLSLFDGVDATETSAMSELVKFAEQLTGSEAEAVAFGTEAPFYNDMGMETIVFGPGRIEQAHQPDEYLAHDAIDPYVGHLRELIRRFCY